MITSIMGITSHNITLNTLSQNTRFCIVLRMWPREASFATCDNYAYTSVYSLIEYMFAYYLTNYPILVTLDPILVAFAHVVCSVQFRKVSLCHIPYCSIMSMQISPTSCYGKHYKMIICSNILTCEYVLWFCTINTILGFNS